MSYTPPRTSTEFDQGERGEALVKMKKKNGKVYILVKFVESGNTFRFRRNKRVAQIRPGRWNLQLSGDETEIWNFSPWSGQYRAKVSEFAAKEGERPAPKVKKRTNSKGQKYETVDFTVLLEVIEPEKFAGITIPYFLRYNFREAEDEEGRSVVGLPDSGSRTKQLFDFLKITGAWNRGPMKYKDNVLPAFEKRILREAKEFDVIVKDGWVDTLFLMNEPEVEDDLDWDDSEDDAEESAPEPEVDDDNDDELDWESE
ncbi:MAG: hypothetical protein ACW97P_09395 [Candidatus Hodarchaeales archaeon]|jgi:hypothetical protein